MFIAAELKVPVELLTFVNEYKLFKALGVYLLLKASCNGHIVMCKQLRLVIMQAIGINSINSFNKHIYQLLTLNWIGWDSKTNTYYVRGFNGLRKQHGFYKSISAVFNCSKDALHMQYFVCGGMLNAQLRKMHHGRNKAIRNLIGSSALITESAIQELSSNNPISAYIGLNVYALAKLWQVSTSQADRIKKQLIKLGYIKRKAKYSVLHTSSKPDFSILDTLPRNRYYSVQKRTHKGHIFYEFKVRLHDEIICLMEFTNQNSIIRRIKHEKTHLGVGVAC